MSRALVALNRLVAFMVGLILIAGAAAGVLWWRGAFPSWPTRIDTRPAVDLAGQTWWPWAAGSLGLALILIGLRWLVANLPNRGISQLRLRAPPPRDDSSCRSDRWPTLPLRPSETPRVSARPAPPSARNADSSSPGSTRRSSNRLT